MPSLGKSGVTLASLVLGTAPLGPFAGTIVPWLLPLPAFPAFPRRLPLWLSSGPPPCSARGEGLDQQTTDETSPGRHWSVVGWRSGSGCRHLEGWVRLCPNEADDGGGAVKSLHHLKRPEARVIFLVAGHWLLPWLRTSRVAFAGRSWRCRSQPGSGRLASSGRGRKRKRAFELIGRVSPVCSALRWALGLAVAVAGLVGQSHTPADSEARRRQNSEQGSRLLDAPPNLAATRHRILDWPRRRGPRWTPAGTARRPLCDMGNRTSSDRACPVLRKHDAAAEPINHWPENADASDSALAKCSARTFVPARCSVLRLLVRRTAGGVATSARRRASARFRRPDSVW